MPSSQRSPNLLRSYIKLRLAVISPFLDRQHGTELCIIEQIERLAQKYHWDIELYSQRVSQVNGLNPEPAKLPSGSGAIRWHRVSDVPGPHLVKYIWWFFANTWQRRRDSRSGTVKPDLIYSPGINCPDANVIVVHIVFKEFYNRVRAELSLRRLPVRLWPLVVHRRLYYRLAAFLEHKIYTNPDINLVAVSSLVAQQLRSHFSLEAVTVIPNAVDTVRFTPVERITRRNEARKTLSYGENDFVLLLIGNDWKKKGLDTVLGALALLGELPLRLLVVGNDEQGLYRPVVNQRGLKDTVRFELPSADVMAFYAASDLYVGPSLEDSFGLPVLEAMACGLPVISSPNSGVSDLIQDGQTGFVLHTAQDKSELAELIRRIQTHEELRFSIGSAASQYVMANCSWDNNAEKTKQLLERALAERRG